MPMRSVPRSPLRDTGRCAPRHARAAAAARLATRQQIFARLGRPQAAAFALPDLRAELLLQLAHGVAQRRLGEVQAVARPPSASPRSTSRMMVR